MTATTAATQTVQIRVSADSNEFMPVPLTAKTVEELQALIANLQGEVETTMQEMIAASGQERIDLGEWMEQLDLKIERLYVHLRAKLAA